MRLRSFLLAGLALAFAGAGAANDVAPAGRAESVTPVVSVEPGERYVQLTSIHSGKSVRVVYRRGADYDSAALAALDDLLRDRRNGELHVMDPTLFDQLFDLARTAGVPPHYMVISGYRSPESNNKMSSRPGSGVAKNSLHMQGRAIDVRHTELPTTKLRDLALAAKRGGVGYYRRSDFLHLDSGRFRTWSEE